MASIERRKRRDGSVAYRVDIRIKRDGRIIHRDSRTFDKQAQAKAWAIKREAELQQPGAFDVHSATVAQLINRYINDSIHEFGRTKREHLLFLARSAMGDWVATSVTSGKLVDWIRRRRLGGTGPATAGNDLIWLKAVYKYGRAAWDMPLPLAAIEDAVTLCRAERLIGRAKARKRRPQLWELEALTDVFLHKDKRRTYPMRDLMWFAIYSARRQDEQCRILWEDNEGTTGLVRDHKHPREKIGNHRRFTYTPEAQVIVSRQPQTDPRIFPFNPRTVGTYFRDACIYCGIEDLHHHDMRHEATSRLFEIGFTIPEVAQVTLHEDWNMLRRYTQLSTDIDIEAREARYRELANV